MAEKHPLVHLKSHVLTHAEYVRRCSDSEIMGDTASTPATPTTPTTPSSWMSYRELMERYRELDEPRENEGDASMIPYDNTGRKYYSYPGTSLNDSALTMEGLKMWTDLLDTNKGAF